MPTTRVLQRSGPTHSIFSASFCRNAASFSQTAVLNLCQFCWRRWWSDKVCFVYAVPYVDPMYVVAVHGSIFLTATVLKPAINFNGFSTCVIVFDLMLCCKRSPLIWFGNSSHQGTIVICLSAKCFVELLHDDLNYCSLLLSKKLWCCHLKSLLSWAL